MVKIKTLWSTLKIRWGCSPIAPPFPPPMAVGGRYFKLEVPNLESLAQPQASELSQWPATSVSAIMSQHA